MYVLLSVWLLLHSIMSVRFVLVVTYIAVADLKKNSLFLVVLGLHCCVGSSLVAVSGACVWLLAVCGLLLQSTGCRVYGFSSCGLWAPEHRLGSCDVQA